MPIALFQRSAISARLGRVSRAILQRREAKDRRNTYIHLDRNHGQPYDARAVEIFVFISVNEPSAV